MEEPFLLSGDKGGTWFYIGFVCRSGGVVLGVEITDEVVVRFEAKELATRFRADFCSRIGLELLITSMAR